MFNCFPKISRFIWLISQAYQQFIDSRKTIYSIVEIDESTESIAIRLVGRSVYFKKKITEAIEEEVFIEGLSTLDAFYLGVIYGCRLQAGKYHQQDCNAQTTPAIKMSENLAQYRLKEINRDNIVTYYDTAKSVFYQEHILSILSFRHRCLTGIVKLC